MDLLFVPSLPVALEQLLCASHGRRVGILADRVLAAGLAHGAGHGGCATTRTGLLVLSTQLAQVIHLDGRRAGTVTTIVVGTLGFLELESGIVLWIIVGG